MLRKYQDKFTIAECEDWIVQLVKLFPKTTLVLDDLDECDECDEPTRNSIVRFFLSLIDQSEKPIKIFVSSRRESHIQQLMPDSTVVELVIGDENHEDIQTFIDAELANMGARWSEDTKEEVRRCICSGSNGMYCYPPIILSIV